MRKLGEVQPKVGFIDMDEVLVDFRGGACTAHGWCQHEVARKTAKLGLWDMDVAMGITADQFWEPIHKGGVEFWETLQPLPWMKDLLTLADKVFSEWHLLTSPSKSLTSRIGKMFWCQRHLGLDFDLNHLHITKHKHLFAKGNTVLIDDREKTVIKFIRHGGNGIVFPSIGNHLRDTPDPVKYVEAQLTRS